MLPLSLAPNFKEKLFLRGCAQSITNTETLCSNLIRKLLILIRNNQCRTCHGSRFLITEEHNNIIGKKQMASSQAPHLGSASVVWVLKLSGEPHLRNSLLAGCWKRQKDLDKHFNFLTQLCPKEAPDGLSFMNILMFYSLMRQELRGLMKGLRAKAWIYLNQSFYDEHSEERPCPFHN